MASRFRLHIDLVWPYLLQTMVTFGSQIQDTYWPYFTLSITDDGNVWFPDSGHIDLVWHYLLQTMVTFGSQIQDIDLVWPYLLQTMVTFGSQMQDTQWPCLTLSITDNGNCWFPDSGYILTLFDLIYYRQW